jgi:hypothetical protein
MDYISLISATGIQILDFPIKLDSEKFRSLRFNYFEGIDSLTMKYWFEELIEIKSQGKLIRKSDLLKLRIEKDELTDIEAINKILNSDAYLFNEDEERTYSIRNVEKTLKQFEKKWIPLPYFKNNQINDNLFGPTDWVRCWFEFNETTSELKLVLAIDTTISDDILKILVKKYGEKPSDHLTAIYTFIDRYSFGIILLSVIKRYFEIVGAKDDDLLVEDLLEMIEQCCFLKNGLKTTTHHIKTEYIKFVDSL